jgi:hypothetical protein
MKTFLTSLVVLCTLVSFDRIQKIDQKVAGEQPNAAIDTKGVIRAVFGKGEQIYCMTSVNNGDSFSKPELVGELSGMHLGHTRGPQIASSKNYSMITAMDKVGNIHSYLLNHGSGGWKSAQTVNDIEESAPEGLMGVTADSEDNFYAVWLDTRLAKQNNIFVSSRNGKGKWSKNKLVYQSPEGHVCECCKPNIAVNGGKLAITFRNWVMGSRDIYYTVSADKGKTFTTAKKTGMGTWKLNACPMDGGGLSISEKGIISTAWQRGGDVFFWEENHPERKLGSGRDVNMLSKGGNPLAAWQANGNIMVMNLKTNITKDLGKGNSPKLYYINSTRSLCLWEIDNQVRYQIL